MPYVCMYVCMYSNAHKLTSRSSAAVFESLSLTLANPTLYAQSRATESEPTIRIVSKPAIPDVSSDGSIY